MNWIIHWDVKLHSFVWPKVRANICITLRMCLSFNIPIFFILGNPRPTITWFKDGAELYQHRFFQVKKKNIVDVRHEIC